MYLVHPSNGVMFYKIVLGVESIGSNLQNAFGSFIKNPIIEAIY